MSALRWATLPVLAGVLTGNIASAAANPPDPPPTPPPVAATDPTPTPTPTPDPAAPTTDPAAPPEPDPSAPAPDSVTYVTTITTTTTIINAPITVVAAPITTNLTTSTSTGAPDGSNGKLARERVVMNLKGCGQAGRQTSTRRRVRHAHVRLAPDATLIVRVNGNRVATLRLPTDAQDRGLRLRLAPNGMLSIQRPSGRILAVQGCTPA